MSFARSVIGSSVLAAATLISAALVAAPAGSAGVDCPSGWDFGPSLKLLQSDGWKVTVTTEGRSVGGAAVAIPPNQGVLWRGTGEGGSDGMTVAFGLGFDNGKVLHYTGVIDPATGSVTGERPDGVTWQSTGSMRCIGGADALPPA